MEHNVKAHDLVVVKVDKARTLLAEAKTAQDAKKVADMAHAAEVYAKRQKLSEEAIQYAHEIKIEAMTLLGEFLAKSPKNRGARGHGPGPGRGKKGGTSREPPFFQKDSTPTLSDLGITKKESNKSQFLKELSKTHPGLHIKVKSREISLDKAKKIVKNEKKQKEAQSKSLIQSSSIVDIPDRKMPCLIVSRAENMPEVASESIDIIITSPPYNLGDDNWPMGGEGRTTRNGIGYDDAISESEYRKWQVSVFNELFRVAKPGASLFYNHKPRTVEGRLIHPMSWILDESNPWTLRQEIIWDRESTHNHSAQLFWPEDERIYWMTKGSPILPDRPIGMSTVWTFFGPVPNTWHPAPFCDELPRRCLQAVGRPGIIVLDPFAGSCTTVRVALDMGYDAIGVEVNEKYLQIASTENGWK